MHLKIHPQAVLSKEYLKGIEITASLGHFQRSFSWQQSGDSSVCLEEGTFHLLT